MQWDDYIKRTHSCYNCKVPIAQTALGNLDNDGILDGKSTSIIVVSLGRTSGISNSHVI